MTGDVIDWLEFMGDLNDIRKKFRQASDALREGDVMICQPLLDEACGKFDRMVGAEIEDPAFRDFLDGLEDEE